MLSQHTQAVHNTEDNSQDSDMLIAYNVKQTVLALHDPSCVLHDAWNPPWRNNHAAHDN